MIWNQYNLFIYFRNLRKERIRLLNLISMAFTLAFALLILFFVEDELSFDRWNENSDHIFRVTTHEKWPAKQFNYATSTHCTGPTLKSEFPEIKSFVRFSRIRNPRVVIESREFDEEKFFYTDSSLFDLFPYKLVEGSREDALSRPYSIVISEDLAIKYFDEQHVLGQTLFMNGEMYTITGIIDNSPKAHLQFNALLSFPQSQTQNTNLTGTSIAYCGEKTVYTYILCHENSNIIKLHSKLPGFYEKYLELEEGYEFNLLFEPMADIHFSNRALENDLPTMNIKYIYIFEVLLVIMLIFSIVNYINLIIGKSLKTGRFIGLNKMYGIRKGQIFSYFISDSLISAMIATLVGLFLLLLIVPGYNDYFNKELHLNILANRHILKNMLALLILVGVVPGILLALIFIPIKPLFILKNQLKKRNRSLQKVFVFLEISLLQIVVLGIIVVNVQLFNLKNTNLGFNKNNIVLIQIQDPELRGKSSLYKDALKKYPGVMEVAASDASVGNVYWIATFHAEIDGQMKAFDIKRLEVDEHFTSLYELELVEGRSFDMDIRTDFNNCLVNEAAVQQLGLGTDVINRRIRFGNNEGGVIIGVVKNFYFTSKHNAIEPLFICLNPHGPYTGTISVKIAPNAIRSTIRNLNQEWNQFSPDSDFSYTLVEDEIKAFYSGEEKVNMVFKWGTLLSFVIVGFGLICFVFFVIEQRIKEISIRKVNGASSHRIVKGILLSEFFKPSIAAFLLVLPVSHFAITGFLRSTMMEASMSWWIYVLTIFVILLTLVLTTSRQLYKAAHKNPVDALGNE